MTSAITALITCFNLEKYIGAAIESVIGQTHLDGVEIVVVDDCSTDRSAEIIRSYPEVRYIRTPRNCGVLLATMWGVEHSSGEYILFLDGDDVWANSKVARVMEAFNSDDAPALVTHDLQFISAEGNRLPRESLPAKVLNSLPPRQREERVRRGILRHEDYVWLGSAYAVSRTRAGMTGFVAFAKELVDAQFTYQDWPLAFWIASLPETRLSYIPEKLFSYRLHGANHSGDASTLAKAVSNAKKSANTLGAICSLCDRFDHDHDIRATSRQVHEYYLYLTDLYSGKRVSAARHLLGALRYLCRGKPVLLKEIARAVGIALMGPTAFLSARSLVRRS